MRVDGVILDIDGVLVDVSSSYRRAIVETVSYLYDDSIPREAVQYFKDAGGFNNDWELTDAVAFLVIARDNGMELDVEEYTAAIKEAGGGLAGAKQVIEATHAGAGTVFASWDPAAIRSVFQQFYLGSELYQELENGTPEIDCHGFIYDEEVLISDGTIEFLVSKYPIGVFTGRPGAEAELALDRIGLDIPDSRRITMDDGAPGKPAPDGILELSTELGVDSIAYVGDTLDDMKTVENAETADPRRSYHGIGVQTGGLSGIAGRNALFAAGADEVIGTIDDLPTILSDGGPIDSY